MRNHTNGMTVLGRRGNTVFMRLPDALQTPIEGGCKCDYCRAHPGEVPVWDTLAVAQHLVAGHTDVTWTVHMPNPRDARE